jgi:dihydrofolate synthase / folylpolyglutamate synthase
LNTYNEVLNWLFVQIPNYQREGGAAYKPGLDNIEKLLQDLSNPQELFPSVHIAGTNGKGSVAHILSAIYQSNKYKVGLFTSPHINDFRERVKIDGEMIEEGFVLDFILKNQRTFQELSATFFEICTALAFTAFAEAEVDIAIVETGMGGRLDSTNVLKPNLAIITNIGLDHTKYLGDTLEKVAFEKAGIIKENVPVLIGEFQKEIEHVFQLKGKELSADVHHVSEMSLDLKDEVGYQQKNAATAYQAIQLLQSDFPVDNSTIMKAIQNRADISGLKGRFQRVGENPMIILDAAHNPLGIKNLMQEIKAIPHADLHLIFGASRDKDLEEIFALFPKKANYYFVEFEGVRSTSLIEFEKWGVRYELDFTLCYSSVAALKSAKILATKNDLILVFGSFFVLEGLE